jgi:hypothetical protein
MITCAVLGTTECRFELITVTARNELSAEERVEIGWDREQNC